MNQAVDDAGASQPKPGLSILRTEDLPGAHRTGRDAADRGQRLFYRLTRARLATVVVAAAAAVPTLEELKAGGHVPVMGIVAALSFTLAFLIEIALLTSRPDELWYEGRALAETAKTLAWRFAMVVPPFPADAVDPENRLQEQLGELITGSARQADLPANDLPPVSDAMRALRAAELGDRRAAYLDGRVADQRDWYRSRARQNRSRAQQWQLALLALEGGSAAAALLWVTGVLPVNADGLLAALITAVAAWQAAKRYDDLAGSYNAAALQLNSLYYEGSRVTTEEHWTGLVLRVEQAISREHTLWLARRVAAPSALEEGATVQLPHQRPESVAAEEAVELD